MQLHYFWHKKEIDIQKEEQNMNDGKQHCLEAKGKLFGWKNGKWSGKEAALSESAVSSDFWEKNKQKDKEEQVEEEEVEVEKEKEEKQEREKNKQENKNKAK